MPRVHEEQVRVESNVMEGLLVKQGRFYRARIDGKVELLSP